MELEKQIRRWLRRYLKNEVSFEAFEDWFVEATWDLQRDKNAPASTKALAHQVRRLMAAYVDDRRTEAQLKRALRPLSPTWFSTRSTQASGVVVVAGVTRRSVTQKSFGAGSQRVAAHD